MILFFCLCKRRLRRTVYDYYYIFQLYIKIISILDPCSWKKGACGRYSAAALTPFKEVQRTHDFSVIKKKKRPRRITSALMNQRTEHATTTVKRPNKPHGHYTRMENILDAQQTTWQLQSYGFGDCAEMFG